MSFVGFKTGTKPSNSKGSDGSLSSSPNTPSLTLSSSRLTSSMSLRSSDTRKSTLKSPAELSQKYGTMIEMMVSKPVFATLLEKKVDSAEMDHFAKSLLHICNIQKKTCYVLHGLLRSEFTGKQVNTILRGNSLTTKLETMFCRQVGQDYLKALFGDILLRLVTDSVDLSTSLGKLSMEDQMQSSISIDPQVRVQENRRRVLDVAQEFVDRFTSPGMLEQMPRPIRAIASYTAELAKLYTPDRVMQFVGGFILLRFFNPAIIAPESLNMLPEGIIPNKQDRQNLIAITRLLQKLSNQVLSTDQEEMEWVNPFIENNLEKLQQYLMTICNDPLSSPGDTPYGDLLNGDGEFAISEPLNEKYLVFLHRHLFESGHFVVTELANQPADIGMCSAFLRMTMCLGPPPQITPTTPVRSLRDVCKSHPFFWMPCKSPQIESGAVILPRFGQSAVVVNNRVFIFGGNYADGSPVNTEDSLITYCLLTRSWQTIGTPDCPNRKFHSAAVCNDSMYIFGGIHNKQTLDDMYSYDLKTKTWSQVNYNNAPPSPRYGHIMVHHNGILYVHGGYTFDGKKYAYSDSTFLYNIAKGQWLECKLENSPSERMHHTAIVRKSSIYVFGGRTPGMDGIGDLHRFDIVSKTWKKVGFRGTPPSPRWGHTMTKVDDRQMIVFGGCDDCQPFADAFMFSFENHIWTEINVETESYMDIVPEPVSHHSAIVNEGRLLVMFGGTYSTTGTLSTRLQELSFELFFSPPNSLINDMELLLNNEKFSDSTIVVEGRPVHVHKMILYARAPRLLDLCEESSSPTVELHGISFSHFQSVLRFIYCGEVPAVTSISQGIELIEFAQAYEMGALQRHIELVLEQLITDSTLMILLLSAERFNLRVLEYSCITTIRSSSTEFLEGFPLERLSPNHLQMLGEQFFKQKK